MSLLVDTNILIRLRDLASPDRPACVQSLQRQRNQGVRLFTCAQVLIEYWVVATRPKSVNGMGLTPAEVERDLSDYLRFMRCLTELPDMAKRWRELVNLYSVSGRPAHDTRLVALMAAHGISRLLTLNTSDFDRYAEIACVTPAQLLAAP